MARLCEEFSAHLRSLMLIKMMRDARSLVAVTNREYEQLEKQALTMPMPVILHGMDTMQDALERMYRGVDRRTEIEMAFLRLCCPELDDSKAALVRRIEALEKCTSQAAMVSNQGTKSVMVPQKSIPPETPPAKPVDVEEDSPAANKAAETVQPVPENSEAAAVPAAVKSAAELAEHAVPLEEWPEILQELQQYSHTIASAFRGTRAFVSGSYVLIDSTNEMAFSLLREPSQRNSMRHAIQHVTGKVYKLGPYRPVEEKKQDPLQALAERAEQQGIDVIKG